MEIRNVISCIFIAFFIVPGFSQKCITPSANALIHANNVKANIRNDGHLFSNQQFLTSFNNNNKEVSGISQAGIWIGGADRAGNTKLSATMGAEQGKSDFFAGPLDTHGVTDTVTCNKWDRIFTVTGDSIRAHLEAYKKAKENGSPLDCNSIPSEVKNWPARGNPFFEEFTGWKLPDTNLASFYDADEDNLYNPCMGDYPQVQFFSQSSTCALIPEQITYFVINDVFGGAQTLSGPSTMQIEVHVHTFAYLNHDALDDMVFTQYRLTNKALEDLTSTYFGLWVDPLLGCPDDNFGYLPDENTLYFYNKSAIDGEFSTNCPSRFYSLPPMVSINLFEKPLVSKGFLRNNNGEFVYNSLGQKILVNPTNEIPYIDTLIFGDISSCVYYDKIPTNQNAPLTPKLSTDRDFYQYLQGMKPDQQAYLDPLGHPTKFVYTGDPSSKDEWTMCKENVDISTTRIIMSVGPMYFNPSESKTLTFAYSYHHFSPLPCPDLTYLRANNLSVFNQLIDCIDLPSRPDCPELVGLPNNQEINFVINPDNKIGIEDFNEATYEILSDKDNIFRFEGYQVYQLLDESVNISDLKNENYARLIFQTDVKNNVSEIVNWQYDLISNKYVPIIEVKGENLGLKKSFKFEKDAFTDQPLENDRPYYFAALAYAHNNWLPFDPNTNHGQKTPYLDCGYLNIYKYTPLKTEVVNENSIPLRDLTIFPNPITNNGDLIISIPSFVSEDWEIDIYNMLGGRVNSRHFTTDRQYISLNRSDLGLISGQYIIRLKDKKTLKTFVGKLVVL